MVRQGRDVAVLALGDFFELGERVANRLAAEYGIEATLVNPRFATELDREFLDSLAAEHRVVVTLEDGILDGGWGERVACYSGLHACCARAPSASPRASPTATTPTSCSLRTA